MTRNDGGPIKLTDHDKALIRWLMRSKDYGDGWRKCATDSLFNLFHGLPSDLIERNHNTLAIRLTNEGMIVAKWLVN